MSGKKRYTPFHTWFEVSTIQKQLDEITSAYRQMARRLFPADFYLQMTSIARVVEAHILPAQENIAQLTARILEAMESTKEWQQSLARVSELARAIDTSALQKVADLAAAATAFQATLSSGLFRDLQALVRDQLDAAEAFTAAGWPIAPSMPRELRDRVVDMYRQGKTRYISQTIMGYYQRQDHTHLRHAVESWERHSLFAPRMHIIKDALELHCEGRFTSSVPTLTPQIEGILNDFVVVNGLEARLGKIRQVYNAVLAEEESLPLSSWLMVHTLKVQLERNTYAFTDFQMELKKSPPRRQTTRHTILHGIMPNYDRPIHSLRMFLLLDALSALQAPMENRVTVDDQQWDSRI